MIVAQRNFNRLVFPIVENLRLDLKHGALFPFFLLLFLKQQQGLRTTFALLAYWRFFKTLPALDRVFEL